MKHTTRSTGPTGTDPSHKKPRRGPESANTSSSDGASRSTEDTPNTAPEPAPGEANLALPDEVCERIGLFLLPPAPAEGDSIEAVQRWRERLGIGVGDCRHASELNHQWHRSLSKAMQALGRMLVTSWLETQPPQIWRSPPAPCGSALPLQGVPPVFQRVPDFNEVAGRLEGLILKVCARPRHFLRVFEVLLTQVFTLAEHSGLPQAQRDRLRAFPLVVLAIAYPRGLITDPQFFHELAHLLLRHCHALGDVLRWRLLQDLTVVLQSHFPDQVPSVASAIADARQSLPPTVQRWQPYHQQINEGYEGPTLDDHLEQIRLLRSETPVGPYGLAVMAWVCQQHSDDGREWKGLARLLSREDPRVLSQLLLDRLIEVLGDAAAGPGECSRAAKAFLLKLFPPELLKLAFERVSGPVRLHWQALA